MRSTNFKLPTFLLCCLMGILSYSVAQAQIEFEKNIDSIKQISDEIVYSEEATIAIMDGMEKIGTQDVVYYSYKGNEIDGTNIIFSKDNQYSNLEKTGDNKIKIHSTYDFYKNENGQVQEIIHKTTSKDVWKETQILTTSEKLKALLKTPYALAESYLQNAGGYVGNVGQATWSAAHNNNPGSTNSDANVYVEAQQHATNNFACTRGYLFFPTSDLDDSVIIATSSLFLYGYNNKAGSENYNIYSVGQTTYDTAVFNNVGTTALANNISATDFNVAGYNEFVLNEIGRGMISATGTTAFAVRQVDYDVNNSSPPANEYKVITYYNYSETGTDKDPYLEITLQTEEEPENPVASSTVDLYPCSIPENTRIDLITGCKNIYASTSSSTISQVEFYYYKIPFIIWIVLGTILIFIFTRLRLEYLIRFRK